MSSRFNEREYEFCFNAEFVHKNSSALIGTPLIPSSRIEHVLGYDVEFQLRSNHFTRSLFLQHKVTSYAEKRSGRNAHIWNCYFGPYYRFSVVKLDRSRQHNLLVELVDNDEDVFYSAPIFVGLDNLQSHFIRRQVIDHSRYFDPGEMGKITDFDQHHVSCDPAGTFGFFHTELQKSGDVLTWESLLEQSKKRRVDLQYAKRLLDQLNDAVKSIFDAVPSVPDDVRETGAVMTLSYILRRYFNVEWLILP